MVREIHPEEIPAVSALWEEMVRELAPELSPRRDWWERSAEQLLASGAYRLLVAEAQGELVGFVDFFVWPEPATGRVHAVGQHFYVRREFRGSASRRLYRTGLELTRRAGCQAVEFFTFVEGMDFWLKKGFAPERVLMRRLYV